MAMLARVSHRPLLPILLALSGAHLLNDLIQSMIPAMYPLLKEAYRLDFTQVGLITLAFQVTSSLLPWSGSARRCSIRKPREWRATPRPASRALRRAFFKSVGMQDMRSGR